jgi:fructose-bisphosphate aldolase class II
MSDYKPIPGSKIFDALKDEKTIIMACNTRIVPGVVHGILRAAKDTDSAVLLEMARSECDLKGGYTGQTPKSYAETVMKIAEEVKCDVWALHADHIGIKKGDKEDMDATKELVSSHIESGFTCFAIDASHLFDFDGKTVEEELKPNLEATIELAKFIKEKMGDKEFGLEVEVGEIGRKNDDGMILTTPEQAVAFIKALKKEGIEPQLLATANGSTHGNIYDKDGHQIAQVSIDIELTKRIAKALRDEGFKTRIAQHGITGTPLEFIQGMFPKGDLIKGNVGTFWQNLFYDVIKVYEPELYKDILGWVAETFKEAAEKKGLKTPEQVFGSFGKKATKEFFDRIYSLRKETVDAIESKAYAEAKIFFEAFGSRGTASKVREYMK